MNNEDYVSFETAKLLKEKGFDEPTEWLYEEGKPYRIESEGSNSQLLPECYSAPTLQMAMKWLRERHELCINIIHYVMSPSNIIVWEKSITDFSGISKNMMFIELEGDGVIYDTYEEAADAAIKYCLENLI